MSGTKIFVPRETAAISVGADEVAFAIAQAAKKNGENIELIRNGSWHLCGAPLSMPCVPMAFLCSFPQAHTA